MMDDDKRKAAGSVIEYGRKEYLMKEGGG